MQAKPSYTVRQVAGLSKESDSTVRRLIDDGELILVAESTPRRITAASVHSYLRRLIDDGPQLPDGLVSATDNQAEAALKNRLSELETTVRGLEKRVVEVEEENERLRNTAQGLRQAQGILLDNLGEYTSPKIPNN